MPEETTVRNRVDTFAVAVISILYSHGLTEADRDPLEAGMTSNVLK